MLIEFYFGGDQNFECFIVENLKTKWQIYYPVFGFFPIANVRDLQVVCGDIKRKKIDG